MLTAPSNHKNQIPWICVLTQAALVIAFLLMTTDITQLANMDGIGSAPSIAA